MTYTTDQEDLLAKILEDDMHSDRGYWESLSAHEKAWVIDALTKEDVTGMNALWEVDYVRRPVTIQEAMAHNVIDEATGEDANYYFGRDFKTLYPYWRKELEIVLSEDSDVFEHIITGPIGGGKTFYSVYANAFKLIRLSCLRNPHAFYGMASGVPIVFSLFNVTMSRADLSAYTQFKSVINTSQYFRDNFPIDRRRVIDDAADDDFKYAIKLPNNIKIILGSKPDSAISANVVGGILDEVNFKELKTAKNTEGYAGTIAFKLYSNVQRRIWSRFVKDGRKMPGILCNVSSRQATTSFLEEHINKIEASGSLCRCMTLPHTCVDANGRGHGRYRITADAIYRMKPREDFSDITFRVMIGNKEINHKILKDGEEPYPGCMVEEVPIDFLDIFLTNIDEGIRDVCGLPTLGKQAYLRDRSKVQALYDNTRENPFPYEIQVYNELRRPNPDGEDTFENAAVDVGPRVEDYLNLDLLVKHWGSGYQPRHHPHNQRFIHLDLALTGDSVGMGMGCIYDNVRVERYNKKTHTKTPVIVPRIWFDFLARIKPVQGKQIDFDKIRQFIFMLRDYFHFPIKQVSTDQYQSAYLRQLIQREGIETAKISMDTPKDDNPLLVRHAIMEGTINMPPFPPFEDEIVELYHDISLRKVDHLPGKSKDVFDAFGGVVCAIYAQEDIDGLIEAPQVNPQAVMPAAPRQKDMGTSFATNEQMFGDLLTRISFD